MATSAVPTKLPGKGTSDPDVTMEDLSSAKGGTACRCTSVGIVSPATSACTHKPHAAKTFHSTLAQCQLIGAAAAAENKMTGNKRPADMQVCPDPAGSAKAKQTGKTGKSKAARTATAAKKPAQKPTDLLADQPKTSKAASKRKLSSASEPSGSVDASAANGKPTAPAANRGTKAKGKPKSENSTAQAADATAAAADEGAAPAEPAAVVGSGRQAAQGVNYREQRAQKEPEECILLVKDVPAASSEADALAATAAGDSEGQVVRRWVPAVLSFEDIPAALHARPQLHPTAEARWEFMWAALQFWPFKHVTAAANALATTAAAECQGSIVCRWIAVQIWCTCMSFMLLALSKGSLKYDPSFA